MITRLTVTLISLILATAASAQSRPSSTGMTCGQASGLVASRGAVVLGTGGQTYDRFVRHRGFCQPTEVTEPAWVRTADAPMCFVGYRCKEAELFFDD